VPINTAAFPSNWELSAARAASVVHVLADEGVDPTRLAVVGYGEFQPLADNGSIEGRNANRRVLLVILAAPQGVDALPDEGPEIALEPGPGDAGVDRPGDGHAAALAGPAGGATDGHAPADHGIHAGAH